jgi:hypothetical protein
VILLIYSSHNHCYPDIVAAVGYNVQSSYFDEFKDSKGVEWKNKLNIKYTGERGSSPLILPF